VIGAAFGFSVGSDDIHFAKADLGLMFLSIVRGFDFSFWANGSAFDFLFFIYCPKG